MSLLFEGAGPRVRAVPASAPFLEVFVEAMIAALWRADEPFALADALILLPNRRAAQGLIDEFAKQLGGAALLPTIRPLGDLDDDADVWGAEPLALDVAPAISATRRRLELAALSRARFKAAGELDDPARAIAMADELCKLLDSAAAADKVDWSLLPGIVEEIDLAKHWRVSAEFLEIITTYWPQRLEIDALADPAARRSALLEALASFWEAEPPTRPVVIAGSTGSVAATRRLMRVVSRLPRGIVVLPGLDADLDDAAWNAIGPQHPQATLKETLTALGLERREVQALGSETADGRARRVLIREALVPADATADWLRRLESAGGAPLAEAALKDLSLIEAAHAEEEATVIALTMREALEDPAQTVALVTADTPLSRRVVEKLGRWGIAPNISHGIALRETAPGVMIALLCELAVDSGDPVALAGLMKHPLAAFGMAPDALPKARAALEHAALRGARVHEDVEDLITRCKPGSIGEELARRIAEALTPLRALERETTLSAFADAVAASAEAVAASASDDGARLWTGRAGDAASNLLREAVAEGDALGIVATVTAPRALMKLLDGREVAPEAGGDPRCAIWGPLEARLQRRDLIILGGLNEGVWPAPPPDDPFLSRAMRSQLGLPSPDARVGLAAHDFAQLASAKRVMMTRALKRGGAPTVASRWIWRLETLLRAAGLSPKRDSPATRWAHVLDVPAAVKPVKAPAPRPPVSARLKRISATQVETLIRDPYALYARRILGLEALKPVGYQPGAAERGTAIHRAIEVAGTLDCAALTAALDQELHNAGFDGARRTAERARLAPAVRAWLDWIATREGASFLEESGEHTFAGGQILSAKADRIEIIGDRAIVVDFKTGAPPSDKEVNAGLTSQLPLEAAMLARGAFPNVPKAVADAFIYWRFGSLKPGPRTVALNGTAQEAADAALAALEGMLTSYAKPEQPFLSSPRVQFMRKYEDYDLLARRKEWGEAEGEE